MLYRTTLNRHLAKHLPIQFYLGKFLINDDFIFSYVYIDVIELKLVLSVLEKYWSSSFFASIWTERIDAWAPRAEDESRLMLICFVIIITPDNRYVLHIWHHGHYVNTKNLLKSKSDSIIRSPITYINIPNTPILINVVG